MVIGDVDDIFTSNFCLGLYSLQYTPGHVWCIRPSSPNDKVTLTSNFWCKGTISENYSEYETKANVKNKPRNRTI